MNGPGSLGYVERLRVPGYLILASAMALPLTDLAFSLVPLHPGTMAWRYGAVGLFSGTIGAPLFMLFLFYGLAFMLEDRAAVIVAMVVAALLALALIASVGAFSLDGLEMKARVQPQAQPRFITTSIQALVKLLFDAFAATVLAVTAFRGLPMLASESDRSHAGASLLVARRTTGRAAKTPVAGNRAIDPAPADAPTTPQSPEA